MSKLFFFGFEWSFLRTFVCLGKFLCSILFYLLGGNKIALCSCLSIDFRKVYLCVINLLFLLYLLSYWAQLSYPFTSFGLSFSYWLSNFHFGILHYMKLFFQIFSFVICCDISFFETNSEESMSVHLTQYEPPFCSSHIC